MMILNYFFKHMKGILEHTRRQMVSVHQNSQPLCSPTCSLCLHRISLPPSPPAEKTLNPYVERMFILDIYVRIQRIAYFIFVLLS